MKKIVLVFAFLLTISFQVNAQWFWQNPLPQGHNLYTVEVINNGIIIIAGSQGTVGRSNDDGSTWQIEKLENTEIEFKASCSNGLNKIWLAGIDKNKLGKIYFSEDTGVNWNLISSIPFLEFENFFLFEEHNAFASYDSAVYKSNDGCLNWYKCPMPQLVWVQDIYFINSQTGWMVADPFKLYKTTNGGFNWDSLSIPNLPDYTVCNDLFFISENNGWMIVDGYKLLRTTDGGINWELNTFYNSSFTNLLFIDESTGFISGYDGEIYTTKDAGSTITIGYQPDGKMKNNIASNSSNKIWAVGENGTIVRSIDNGNNWVTKSSGFYFNHFTGMQFTSRNTGFVSGDDKILRTTDGGNNWTIIFDDSIVTNFESMFFLNEQTGWAFGRTYQTLRGRLLRTTDSGNSWESMWEITPLYQGEIFFVDPLYGWINFFDGLMRTTDGGYTWNTVSYNDFTDLYFTSRDIGWASSYIVNGFDINGIISKTTDGGLNWLPILEDSLDLLIDIIFLDNNLGVAVGGDPSTNYIGKNNFIITMDGGASWQKKSFDFKFHRIQFLDYSKAVATIEANGLDKIILTKDAGITWEDEFLFSHGDFDGLGAIAFVDSTTGWISGTFSSLLKTTNGGVTFIDNEEKNYTQPKEFLLHQNYPNPFNPSTDISYSIPNSSLVQIKIFDVLGREVSTLLNEEKIAGNYKINFNASNLTSGVYFYRLQAGSFVQTKKMILIK